MQLREPGLHTGMGAPSSGAGIAGAASAVYVQHKPAIRNSILSTFFIGSFLLVRSPGSGNLNRAELYRTLVTSLGVTFDYRQIVPNDLRTAL